MALTLGRVGARLPHGLANELEGSELRTVLDELEEAGWGAVWFAGTVAEAQMPIARKLLDHSQRMVVASGIIQIFGSDPAETANMNRALLDDHPGRFLLGLGVSHPEAEPDGTWAKPLAAMRTFLDGLDAADPNADPTQRALAALGPKMMALAAERTAGAHPYFVPVAHTAAARNQLGPNPLLAPEQMVVLDTDPERARRIARAGMQLYLGLTNYTRNLRTYGFGDEDFAAGGSDRLVDAIVAWGDVNHIAARIRAQHDAGADHVCVQVLTENPGAVPRQAWRELGAALS